MTTIGAGAITAAPAQASCQGVPAASPLVYRCTDPYSGDQCYSTDPDPYSNSGVCVDPNYRPDPNNLCIGPDTCITGISDNIQYLKSKVGELERPVNDLVDYALGVAGGVVGDVEDLLNQPICVAPLDPSRPICIT